MSEENIKDVEQKKKKHTILFNYYRFLLVIIISSYMIFRTSFLISKKELSIERVDLLGVGILFIILLMVLRKHNTLLVNEHGLVLHYKLKTIMVFPYRIITLPDYDMNTTYIPETLIQEMKKHGIKVLIAVYKSDEINNALYFVFIKRINVISSVYEEYKKTTNTIETVFSSIQDIRIIKEQRKDVQNLLLSKKELVTTYEFQGKLQKNEDVQEHAFFMLPVRSILEQEKGKRYFQVTFIDETTLNYRQIVIIQTNTNNNEKLWKLKKLFHLRAFVFLELFVGNYRERGENSSWENIREMRYFAFKAKGLDLRPGKIMVSKETGDLKIEIGRLFKGVDGRNIEVMFPIKELVKNIEVIGAIGYGKTSFILSLAKQLTKNRVGVLIFDVKGEYSATLENKKGWVIYRLKDSLNPLRINFFQEIQEHDTGFLVSLFEEVLLLNNKELTAPMKVLLERLLLEIITNIRKPNIYTFVASLQRLKRKYKKEKETQKLMIIEGIQNRLSFLFEQPIFQVFNTMKTTIRIEELFQGKGIVIDLSDFTRRGNNYTSFYLVTTLLLKAVVKASAKQGITSYPRITLVFEEALITLPKATNENQFTTAEQLFILGRSLGIGNILVSQHWENISNLIHGNTLTKIFFRYQGETKSFQHLFTKYQLRDLSSLSVGEFILLNGVIGEVKLRTIEFTEEKTLRKIKYETLFKARNNIKPVYKNFSEFKLHLLS